MIYLVLFILLLYLAVRYDLKSNGAPKIVEYLIFIALVLVAGFRYRVGTDTLVYMDEYNYDFSIIKYKYLIGWSTFMNICKSLNFSFYIVQLIVALIINWGVFVFIKRYIPNYFFTGLLVYSVILYPGWNFEVLRQAICVSLFFLSLRPLEEKKYIWYYLIIAIACTIHETSYLLLFVPLLFRIRINKGLLRTFGIVVAFFIVMAPLVRGYVVEYALLLFPYEEKAAHYFQDVDTNASFNLGFIFNVLLNIGIPFWVMWQATKSDKIISGNQYAISDTIMFLVLISFITYTLSLMLPMMYRIHFFFTFPNLLLFVYLFNDIANKTKNTRLVFFALLLVFIGFKFRIYLVENNGIPLFVHYYPYHSILDEEIEPLRELIDKY